jgi:hypothetical protein
MATTVQRGCGREHQRLGEQLRPMVEAGEVICSRCGRPILPGQRWHVDHDDADRSLYRDGPTGPTSHAFCNIGAVSKRRARLRRARFWSVEW